MIGQSSILKELDKAIVTIKREGKILPHILLYGDRGMGKTTLAGFISGKLGTKLTTVNGGMLSKENMGDTFLQLKKGDILFIDEVHSLKIGSAEELYTPMESFEFNYYFMGAITKFKVPPFTLIGATTEAGKLPKPLLDRFVYAFIMEKYTEEEMGGIIKLNQKKPADEDALLQLVNLSQGNPRVGINLLISCENLVRDRVTLQTVNELMELRGIRANGLSKLQMDYLSFLNSLNVPVGKNYLATFMSVSESTVEHHIEPLLVQRGLILRGPSGRLITPKAKLLFM